MRPVSGIGESVGSSTLTRIGPARPDGAIRRIIPGKFRLRLAAAALARLTVELSHESRAAHIHQTQPDRSPPRYDPARAARARWLDLPTPGWGLRFRRGR